MVGSLATSSAGTLLGSTLCLYGFLPSSERVRSTTMLGLRGLVLASRHIGILPVRSEESNGRLRNERRQLRIELRSAVRAQRRRAQHDDVVNTADPRHCCESRLATELVVGRAHF